MSVRAQAGREWNGEVQMGMSYLPSAFNFLQCGHSSVLLPLPSTLLWGGISPPGPHCVFVWYVFSPSLFEWNGFFSGIVSSFWLWGLGETPIFNRHQITNSPGRQSGIDILDRLVIFPGWKRSRQTACGPSR